MVLDSRLRMSWIFDTTRFSVTTLTALADDCQRALTTLLEHCLSAGERRFTPSDFPDAPLNQDELDDLMAEYGEDI